MVIYILFITLVLFFLASYLIFDKDLLSPPVILCVVFVVSCLCSIYNIDNWSIELRWNTYLVVTGGVLLFLVVSFFVNFIMAGQGRRSGNKSSKGSLATPYTGGVIEVQGFKIALVLLWTIVVGILYINQVARIASSYGASGSLSQVLSTYRSVASYGVLEEGEGIPFLVNNAYQISMVFAYIMLYVFVNNLVEKQKNAWIAFLPVLVYLTVSVFTGGRLTILRFAAAALVTYWVLWHRKFGWHRSIGMKFIVGGILMAVAVLGAFLLLRYVVGRGTDVDPFYYLTMYAGGPIPLLDLYLENPPAPSGIWGKETFYGINRFIGDKLGVSELMYIIHKEFRYANGLNMGNIYTCFRYYIQDFGYVGMVILTSISSVFFNTFYNLIKKPSSRRRDMSLIIYGYCAFGVFMMPIQDQLFSVLLSVNTVKIFVFLWAAKLLLIDYRFVVGKYGKRRQLPIPLK